MTEQSSTMSVGDYLESKRVVALDGRIDTDMIDNVLEHLLQLQILSNEPITLVINSGGGNSTAALRLCDFIEHVLVAPVHAYVIGECSSAATLILLYCEKRFCTRFSYFVVHSGTLNGVTIPIDNTSPKQVEDLLKEVERDREQAVDLYMSKLRLSRKKVERLIARGDQRFNEALHAAEAIEVGLIHEILEDKIPIFTKE